MSCVCEQSTSACCSVILCSDFRYCEELISFSVFGQNATEVQSYLTNNDQTQANTL